MDGQCVETSRRKGAFQRLLSIDLIPPEPNLGEEFQELMGDDRTNGFRQAVEESTNGCFNPKSSRFQEFK